MLNELIKFIFMVLKDIAVVQILLYIGRELFCNRFLQRMEAPPFSSTKCIWGSGTRVINAIFPTNDKNCSMETVKVSKLALSKKEVRKLSHLYHSKMILF